MQHGVFVRGCGALWSTQRNGSWDRHAPVVWAWLSLRIPATRPKLGPHTINIQKNPERVDAGLKWLHYFLLLSDLFDQRFIRIRWDEQQRHRAVRSGDPGLGTRWIGSARAKVLWYEGTEHNQNTILQSYSCMCRMCYEFLRGILTWIWIKLFFTLFALSAGGVSPRLEQKKT